MSSWQKCSNRQRLFPETCRDGTVRVGFHPDALCLQFDVGSAQSLWLILLPSLTVHSVQMHHHDGNVRSCLLFFWRPVEMGRCVLASIPDALCLQFDVGSTQSLWLLLLPSLTAHSVQMHHHEGNVRSCLLFFRAPVELGW